MRLLVSRNYVTAEQDSGCLRTNGGKIFGHKKKEVTGGRRNCVVKRSFIICTLHIIYIYGAQIVDDEMGRARIWGHEKCKKKSENLKGKDLGDVSVDEKIILTGFR
jgi:hypothetical protein